MHRLLSQLFSSAAALLRRLVTPLLGVSREHWRCCCQLTPTEVMLTREFLPGAQTLRVELHTWWPASWNWLMPRLAAHVLDAAQQPLQLETVSAQSCQNGMLCFSVTFPAAHVADQERFWIQLFGAENAALITEVEFARLNRDQLLSELKVCCLESYVCLGERRVVTQRVHSGLKQIGACFELQLLNVEHRALFGLIPAQVGVVLTGPPEKSAAWKTKLQFCGQKFRWEVPLTEALPLLREHSGDYQLTLLLENQVVARRPLTMCSERAAYVEALAHVEAQATLDRCYCESINHREQRSPLDVVAEDFRQIHTELAIGVTAPDVFFNEFLLPLTCEFRSRDGQMLISRQALEVTLHPGTNVARLILDLQPHQFRRATSDCVLELHLGNRLLRAIPVTHKTRHQIIQEKNARLLESLSLTDVELAVEREGEVVVTEAVFATDRRLKPRFKARAECFDEDVPRLEWELTVQLRHIASRRTFEQIQTLRIRAGSNRCNSLAIRLEQLRACLPPGRCMLSLCCADRELAQREFRFVAEDEILAYTQELLLENLRVLDQQLVCESRNHAYATQTIPFCADRVHVRLTLRSDGFNAVLPEWNVPLHLKLEGARRTSCLVYETTVTLSPLPTTLDLPFDLPGTSLGDQPGNYHFELHLADREIARIPFRMVAEAEIVERIEVSEFHTGAVRHQGGGPVRCTEFSPQEHRELRIAFGVRAELPAPGFALPGRIEILARQRVLVSSDFLAPLEQETTMLELKPLPLAALWAKAGECDETLQVQISVGGTVKSRHPLKLQSRLRVTNFEGALTQDAHALGNVDEEYEAIMQGLGR